MLGHRFRFFGVVFGGLVFFFFSLKVISFKNGILEEKRKSSHFQVKFSY